MPFSPSLWNSFLGRLKAGSRKDSSAHECMHSEIVLKKHIWAPLLWNSSSITTMLQGEGLEIYIGERDRRRQNICCCPRWTCRSLLRERQGLFNRNSGVCKTAWDIHVAVGLDSRSLREQEMQGGVRINVGGGNWVSEIPELLNITPICYTQLKAS